VKRLLLGALSCLLILVALLALASRWPPLFWLLVISLCLSLLVGRKVEVEFRLGIKDICINRLTWGQKERGERRKKERMTWGRRRRRRKARRMLCSRTSRLGGHWPASACCFIHAQSPSSGLSSGA
jgi:hypothetical protein